MPGVAIVAIPAEDDYVWRISSEKVPHMTLLYLGDLEANPKLANIENFVQHVVSSSMFLGWMSVAKRGVLGPDEADVVFFEKHGPSYTMFEDARAAMLQNTDIHVAYNSTQQFPEWTPHLTLGYPPTPAKPDMREYPGIHGVRFDKIAIWFGNFDGPEFELNPREEVDLAMADHVSAILSHAATFSTKPWSDFQESDYDLEQWKRACLISPAQPSNSKSDYKLPVKEPDGTYNQNAIFAVAAVLAGGRGGVSATTEQKAAATKKVLSLYAQMGKKPPASLTGSAKHSDLVVDDILAHHGVKGMKWGVRKDSSVHSTSTTTSKLRRPATDVTARQRPGQFVRTSGGKRQTAAEDAVRVAASRQLAKKSTTDVLSNKQLQDAVTRMNLEQQYSQLAKRSDRRTRGQRFIQTLLGTTRKEHENSATAETAKQVAAALAKKAAAAAATA